jgi:galactokinase/mevalonate kinase-like predicted kinase
LERYSKTLSAASFEGLNYSVYEPNGNLRVENIPLSSEQILDLEKKSLLLFTGMQRKADLIASDQVSNIKNNIRCTGRNFHEKEN